MANPSQNKATASQNKATAPRNNATAPRNEATASQNEATASQNEATASQNEPTAPRNEATASQNEPTAPRNEAMASRRKPTRPLASGQRKPSPKSQPPTNPRKPRPDESESLQRHHPLHCYTSTPLNAGLQTANCYLLTANCLSPLSQRNQERNRERNQGKNHCHLKSARSFPSLQFLIANLSFLILFSACSPQSSTLDDSAISSESGQLVLTTESDSAFEALEEMDHADRENWQKPQMVISRLGDLSDKVVADIGAGTGYFTMPLARKASKVIAIDIEQEFLDYIQRRLSHSPDRGSLNIETRLVKPEDPMLNPAEADLVLIVNTYAYIEHRVAYFQKVFQGLKPDGRLVVIDFKKDPLPVGPPTEAKLDPAAVSLELDSAGFRTITVDNNSLEYQYTLTAEKRQD